MIISVDLTDLEKLSSEGEKIFLKPEAETALLKILELEEKIKEVKEQARKALEEAALKYNPNFKSITADNLKIYYRSYGSKYLIDESQIKEIDPSIYSTEVEAIPQNGLSIDEISGKLSSLGWAVKSSDREGIVKYSVARVADTKAIEKFVKENKAFPLGVIEADRPKSITFSKKSNGETTEE